MNVIEVENVSKMFRLGTQTGDLREQLNLWMARRRRESRENEFWALQDISFDVAQGESFGIIGHNGSGKSTLLKLITGIYKPTTGTFQTRGRVAALIEVGAGFHPDLTGRENVYLNGSVLGMKKREIDRCFDEIVAFAELERFIDTPVKRYSSGMYMRLGFAVAAHIDPEIVLVDEVLAVGDEAFQAKCMNKMLELRAQGRTIIFISHAMGAITTLCQRVMLLDQGRIEVVGTPEDVITAYRNGLAERARVREVAVRAAYNGLTVAEQEARDETALSARDTSGGAIKPMRILGARLLDRHGLPCEAISMYDSVRFECEYEARERVDNPAFGLALMRAEDGAYVCGINTANDGISVGPIQGRGRFGVTYDHLNLLPGQYFFTASLCYRDDPDNPVDLRWRLAYLDVKSDNRSQGLVLLPHSWHLGSDLEDTLEATLARAGADTPRGEEAALSAAG